MPKGIPAGGVRRERAVSPPETPPPRCMDAYEWRLWWSETLDRDRQGITPCGDCPVSYAARMRAQGRCDGVPGGEEP